MDTSGFRWHRATRETSTAPRTTLTVLAIIYVQHNGLFPTADCTQQEIYMDAVYFSHAVLFNLNI